MNDILSSLCERAEKEKFNLYSIALMQSGEITEKRRIPADLCTNSYSVAKAFIVTAIGMLWDQKMIRPDDRVCDILHRECPRSATEAWKDVTVEHLLTHKVGFGRGFLDIDTEKCSEYPTNDFLSMIWNEPIPYAPGTHFQYTDAAFYMLSVIITKLTGKRADDFLRPILFDALHFDEAAFSVCPKGYSVGATGLYLRTRDMVKLGYVYAQDGVFNGKRIVSSDWVSLVLSRGYEFKPIGDSDLFAKGGMFGQMLCFSRKRGFAVAWHGYESRDVRTLLENL